MNNAGRLKLFLVTRMLQLSKAIFSFLYLYPLKSQDSIHEKLRFFQNFNPHGVSQNSKAPKQILPKFHFAEEVHFTKVSGTRNATWPFRSSDSLWGSSSHSDFACFKRRMSAVSSSYQSPPTMTTAPLASSTIWLWLVPTNCQNKSFHQLQLLKKACVPNSILLRLKTNGKKL